ncbi:helix-turn-helix domain-containing protein [Streptomyces lavendofoliae]|uniref:helix-turn-helix domain-containing protein n=1 Tax=Streptomyces lavendofoliae TaxID=67314 RepID=UPI003D8BB1E1
MAATGLTNREIVGILHLSPRTVEQHIARAMQKAGTASRTALVEPGDEACGESLQPRGEQIEWDGRTSGINCVSVHRVTRICPLRSGT